MKSQVFAALSTWPRHTVVAVGLVAALASCSSPDGSGTTTPGSTPSASTGNPTPAAQAPPTLPARPARTVPLDRVGLQQVALKGGGGPDWMAAGFGSLWVRRDNAVVTRLSPDGRVLATIDAGIWQQPVCQGLGVSDTAVWGCATSGKLMRIDPSTNRIAAIVDVPKVNEQGRLVPYDDRIWVLTGDGDQLVGVSETTNELGPPIDLGAFCTDVADELLGATLWVACPYDGAVLRVDLEAGEVTGRVDGLPNAAAVAAGRDVWVCTDDGVARVDGSSLEITAVQPAVGGLFCGLRLAGDTLWVRTPSTFLTAIDTSTGEVAEVITAPGPASGGDVVEFADAVWVSAYDRGLVYEVTPPPH